MTSNTEFLLSRKEGGIGWMTFNNPAKHNAISVEMALAVPAVMADFDADPDIRVVIVTGMGERAFAAGSNISAFGDVRTNPEQNRAYHDMNEASYGAVYACSKPTIAMIHGYCIGGGLDFASSCDIRICDDRAQFAIPAVKLGLGFSWEGQVRLSRLLSPAHARDLFFSGRRWDAAEALRTGLVHQVAPAADLEAAVLAYAAVIAANAPMTLRALKRGFLEQEKPAGSVDMQPAQDLIDACYRSHDYLEGRDAFAAKRAPNFKGA
jgi:enoyl-CoA hydratase